MTNKKSNQEKPTLNAIMAGLESLSTMEEAKKMINHLQMYQTEFRKEKNSLFNAVRTEATERFRELKDASGGFENEKKVFQMGLDRIERQLKAAHENGTLTKALIQRTTQPFRDVLFDKKDKEGNVIEPGLLSNLPQGSIQPYTELTRRFYQIIDNQESQEDKFFA